jgi:tRNA A37 threonylcarbamoyladenosine synthetase subunit TsaC/SUA5/YrdC
LENYKKIYELKNRDFSKPLAILVDDFKFFEENKILNKNQIDFLKNYKKPFTIIVDRKKLNLQKEKILDKIEKLPNKKFYEKIAFRVARNFMHKKLIRL